ncbi:chemotaxis protein : Response regulator receiver OS=Planctomyces limnophilus (strain ATCC 43296 / DSM 3776 / IFAM 1008 / 290) GN=Plim_3722 PE=4 SV=1: Response_reg [Gemmataceae bacterium]|nr:chemotaxis protein : Response regulator receiver OS=Planctomyces limnophilus (strain ATCC 43296 / DSM 3776 / IFAM 1008 / 290) GN=Plim_3722 PE=4 SV=1: Response_reg [Gemmataceae bacterium]VTT98365.1 chemotaxis protein : Response regulator receiver OS=Planctomyces limnophilus (strain ATCC 43296 / DSM 3776 / IFAM 1008 / 290) GN=Plim_3722 PE=4 SV=1: Response_reg [Gemmataceae bacterium]
MAEQKLILVVDDDRELVEGVRAVLERQGYKVIQAHDGHQGKQAIYNQQPDLVILDMMMPRMGGYPLLEHFRDKADAPPIIMITANEGSRHKAYAEWLGVIDYIRKPFAMEKLLDTVTRRAQAPRAAPPAGRAQGRRVARLTPSSLNHDSFPIGGCGAGARMPQARRHTTGPAGGRHRWSRRSLGSSNRVTAHEQPQRNRRHT